MRGADLQDGQWFSDCGTSRTILTKLGRDGALPWRAAVISVARDTILPRRPHYDRVFSPLPDGAGELQITVPQRSPERCESFAPISLPAE